jgi:alpha-galactosidase
MRNAIYAAGRPIVFSLCEWGNNVPWEWGKEVGHLWRISGDIAPIFDGEEGHGNWSSWGVLQILDMRKDIRKYAGPDHWNDLDMMEVGNGMSVVEDRAHFSLWCMMASPLMAGNDLRNMNRETIDILTNKEVIAVNQDSLGIQGFKCFQEGDWEIWAKPLKGGDLALCFLNRGKSTEKIEFDLGEKIIKDDEFKKQYLFAEKEYRIRDLWAKKDIGTTKQVFKTKIASHEVVMLRLFR